MAIGRREAIGESREVGATLTSLLSGAGMLPVIESGRPVGLITDRDLVIRVLGEIASHQQVGEVMTRPPICLHEQSDVDTAIETMRANRIARLLVVDEEGRLTGVLSLDDLAVALCGDRRIGLLAEALGRSHRRHGSLTKASR